ncbi:hypothetical protein AKJ50_00955 [candidate division MSBL1 archaeon SCGC-AAA382A13]|uniref:Uncharacterized protein n=2 Tax=candidate division MSBL1 TaxID=215777 RepID=A0A133VE93_9EURY|nr:hypothetical protein AKJ49_01720 [candidate division MSBL1 archaeon SCGC-AAA382A03]KXB05439.1 hypothetical protein AKJ50_00955 [candidate division MSBL1 archaeon SCGC-AAA382A13]
MVKILEIHLDRKLPDLSKEKITEAKRTIRKYPNVELEKILSSEKGIAVEIWEAPDTETVREIIQKVMGPNHCDKIIEVKELEL